MKLSIYSLRKILYEGEAKSINCQTVSGEITILNRHCSLISMLKEGVIKVLDNDNKEHYINVKSGFLEVGAKSMVRFIVEE